MKISSFKGPNATNETALSATTRVNEFVKNGTVTQELIAAINSHSEVIDDAFLKSLGEKFPKIDLMTAFKNIVSTTKNVEGALQAVQKFYPYFVTAVTGAGFALKKQMEAVNGVVNDKQTYLHP